jgi:drug/metabolite transporter (DMT)-like permease
MVMIFALTAAVLYGSADFLGGTASRRVSAVSVLQVAKAGALVVSLAAALAFGEAIRPTALAWGAGAGVIGGIGMIVFYAGLAAGPMAVVAPVSAVTSTVVPVAAALVMGERLTPPMYAGTVLCLAAVAVISADPSSGRQHTGGRRRAMAGLAYGLASGAAFGLFLLLIRNGGEAGTLWPVAAAQAGGTLAAGLAGAAVRARPLTPAAGGPIYLAALGAGVIDSTGSLCYLLATQAGLLGMAVVLSSLYPGVTVLLARFVLGERMHRAQCAGLVLAVLGIVLVTW